MSRLALAALVIFGAVTALATWQPRPPCRGAFTWLPGRDVVRLDLARPSRTFTVDPGGEPLYEVQCDELARARRFAWYF